MREATETEGTVATRAPGRIELGVVEGVHRVEDAAVNWYLVEDGSGVTVVDAGLPRSWRSLLAALNLCGRRLAEIRAIVLTHPHYDHVGFAERVRAQLGVPVLVPEGDREIAAHPLRFPHERSMLRYAWRPRPARLVAGMMLAGAPFTDAVSDVEVYRPGDTLDVPGRPTVVATPGHTPGHCSLLLPDRDAVIAGDALVNLDPYTGRQGPRLVARAATADSQRALASLAALAETGAGTVLPGHGEPWPRGVEEAVAHARRAGIA